MGLMIVRLRECLRPAFLVFLLCLLPACAGSQSATVEAGLLSKGLTEPVDLDRIEAMLEDNDVVGARNMISMAILAKQSGPKVDMLVAEYQLMTGAPATAEAGFRQHLDSPEFAARASQGLGLALLRRNAAKEAQDALEKAVELDPSLWRSWNALGALLDRGSKHAEARAAYEKALEIVPGKVEVRNNLGFSHILAGELESAIEVLGQLVQERGDMEIARANLRLAFALRGDYVRALAGSDGQDLRRHLNNAGYAAYLRGDMPTAEALLTSAMEESPSFYVMAHKNMLAVKGAGGEEKPAEK